MNRFLVASLGLAAVVLSTGTIVLTAAHRTDGYSHLTKAVSELGSPGASGALVFNLFGYLLPGVLIAIFAWGLRGWVKTNRPVAFYLLGLSGLMMSLAGAVPIDLNFRTAPAALVHTAGSLGSGFCWLGCAITLRRSLRADGRWRLPARVLPWLPVAALAGMLFVSENTPGLRQRVSFGGYFVFVAGLAGWLWRLPVAAKSEQPSTKIAQSQG